MIATVADARSAPVPYAAVDVPQAGVRHADGTEALNLCPYSADGELLSGVLVFDQAGRPITEIRRVPGPNDGLRNAYPRDIRVPSIDGVLREAPCPKLATVKIRTNDEPSWIEAIVGGTPVYRGLVGPGESRTFYGETIFLVVGNAGAVKLEANGASIGTLGARGEVYRGTFDRKTKRLPPSGSGPQRGGAQPGGTDD